MADRGITGNLFAAGSPPNPRTGVGSAPQRGMGTVSADKGSKPVFAPYELTEDAFNDGTDVAQKARLYSESVGYPNLADNKFVVEQAKGAILSGLKDVFNVQEFWRNKWLIFYRLWRGDSLDSFSYGRTQLHSPEPFKAVEAAVPKVMRALFANDRNFRLYGEQEEHDSAAKLQELLCRRQLRDCDFKSHAQRFIRSGLIYGTAIQKTYWKQEQGHVAYRTARNVPDPDFPGRSKKELSKVERDELVFDGNMTKQVEVFNFLSSPNATTIDEAEWCADRSSWPDYKVKFMGQKGHWKNLEMLRDHPGSNDISFGDEFLERKAYSYGVFDPRQASQAPHIPHYQVIDWWGPLPIRVEGGNIETRMCNVVMVEPDSLQLIVRVTECPYWHNQKPYQVWRPISMENELFGVGLIEMIARLSLEKDMKLNLAMATQQLAANPGWLVADDANIPTGQLLAEPGLVLRVPDIQNSVAPLHVPDVSDAALKAMQITTKEIRETTGVTSPAMGAGDPFSKDKTATQHMADIDESNMRMVPMIENFENEVQVPMLNQMVWNNQQFMSYPRVVRDMGELGTKFLDRYTISPSDIIGRFLVQPLASHRLTTKMTQVQQLVNILDRAPIINQMYGPNAVKMPKLLSKILKQGFDMQDVDEIISVPDEADLLTPTQEHQLWYHGNVPRRKADDNDLRHIIAHMEEIGTEAFDELGKVSPQTVEKALAHIADHYTAAEQKQMRQEDMLQQMAQVGAQMGLMQGGPAGGSPVAGAGGPGQDPNSPKVRTNEEERGEAGGAKSEGTSRDTNAGAS